MSILYNTYFLYIYIIVSSLCIQHKDYTSISTCIQKYIRKKYFNKIIVITILPFLLLFFNSDAFAMNRNVGGGNQQQGANQQQQQQQQGANQQQQQQAVGRAPRSICSNVRDRFYSCADRVVSDNICCRNTLAAIMLGSITAVGVGLGIGLFQEHPSYITGLFGAAWGFLSGGAVMVSCYYGKNQAIRRRQGIAANNPPGLPVVLGNAQVPGGPAPVGGGNVQGPGNAAPGGAIPGGAVAPGGQVPARIGNGHIPGLQMPQAGGPGGPAPVGGGNVQGPGNAAPGGAIPGGAVPGGQVPAPREPQPDLLLDNVQIVDGRGSVLFMPLGPRQRPQSAPDLTLGIRYLQVVGETNSEGEGESPGEGPSGVQQSRSSTPESNQCFLMGESDDSSCCSSCSSLLSASGENSCCIDIEPSSSPVQATGSRVSIASSSSSSSSPPSTSWHKGCGNQGDPSQDSSTCSIEMQVLMSNQGGSENTGSHEETEEEEEDIDTNTSSSSSQVNIPLLAGASQGDSRTNEEQHSDSEDDDAYHQSSSSVECTLLSLVKETTLFIPGYTQEGQIHSLVSLQGLLLNMSEQVSSGLKMLALKTYRHMRNTKNVHQYQYSAFTMGRKTSIHPSVYAPKYQQDFFQSLIATKIFAFSDTSMSNLEYKVGSGHVGLITPLTSIMHVGLTFNHTKGISKDGIGVQVGTAFGSSKSKAETKGFSAIMAWNPESNGFTGHLASCYNWGKAKNTRYVTYAGKEVCSKGTPDMHLVGGLAQFGYNFYIGRAICVTPYLEYMISNVGFSRYVEQRGSLPCKISTNREKRWEQSIGLRSRWEMTSTTHLQTWIATVTGSSHTHTLSSTPVMVPIALYTASAPTHRKRYTKTEFGISYESNITEFLNVSLNSNMYIGNTKHTDGQYVGFQVQFQY